ncbi:MAG: hypothetical protein JKX79_01040 [Labilibaculum sp.]|nr:hypothetical protein [Labilibaculum sp.]
MLSISGFYINILFDEMRLAGNEILKFQDVTFFGNQHFSLADLPEEIRENIFDLGEFRKIKNQQNVVDIGEYCTEIFWVINGAFVCQYFEEELAIERTINFHIDSFHSFMTSVESYFYNTKSKYKLKAVRQSEVIVFKRSAVNELIENNSFINQLCFAGLTSALTSEIKLRSKLTILPADKFYSYLITNYPQIIQQIPSKYIAEFMGITQEWLSKLKRK